MKRMSRTSEVSVLNITHECDSPSEYEDIATSSPRGNERISNNAWPNAFVSSAGNTGDAGSRNGGLADCTSPESEEFASYLAQVETECGYSNEEPLPDHTERCAEVNENHYSDTAVTLVSDALLFKNHNTPEEYAYIKQSKDGKVAYGDMTDENTDNWVTPPHACVHPMVEQCPGETQFSDLKSILHCQHSHFKLLDTKNELSDKFTLVTSQPSNERMQYVLRVCHKEKSAQVKSSFNGNEISLNERIGKERVLNARGNKSVSKEKDDSNESAESSNSKESCAKGKRVWSYEQETLMGSKRVRKSIEKNSFSGSHVREGSSFMNWVSSVTKGFFRSDHVETHSLGLIPHPVPNMPKTLILCPRSNDGNHNAACGSMGFGSIFKALYCPRVGKPREAVSSNYQEECVDFNRLHFNDRPAGSVKAVPISSMRKDQGIYQVREPTLSVPNISLQSFPIRERRKHNVEYCNLCNVGSSSMSFQSGSSSSEGKEASKLGTSEPNKFSNLSMMSKAGSFPSSLRIPRFLSNVTASTLCATQCNQDTVPAAEKITDDCTKILPCSQNGTVSVSDCSDSQNVHLSSEEQRPYICGHLHECSTRPLGSYFSKKVQTDPKSKFKLNPILPSQTLKKLEPMTSVFAKRLDAFRHIKTSEVQDDVTPESATCFFCGKNGHSKTACSDVSESELKDLMLKMNSYTREDKTSCICSHSQLNDHLAAACPYASLSSHYNIDSNTCAINPENFVRKNKGHGNYAPLTSEYGAGMCNPGEEGQNQFLRAHGIHCREIPGNVSGVQARINMDILDPVNLKGSVLTSYLIKDVCRKAEAKGKQIASTSTEIDPIGKPLMQTIDTSNKSDKQHLIFERIRKLHVSRNEINRWMESSASHLGLVGFFLRVKIGKWEEDLGGTGYHVACISGPSGQKLYGCSKSHLPVDIGGLKCLIDCCSISNHDFTEDELRAWWLVTLRRGGRLPSEEYLDMKLEYREKFRL